MIREGCSLWRYISVIILERGVVSRCVYFVWGWVRGLSIAFGDRYFGPEIFNCMVYSCGGYIFDGGDYLKVENFTVALYISREYG